MATSITEKILSTNKFYTDSYIKDTINLTKSISFTNQKEADMYNEYVVITYPTFNIDYSDKTTWRYYLHLSGNMHPVDKEIVLTSFDNGSTITLNRTTISLHRLTRKELLKFDLMYKELIDKYPEQELYIKSVIATSTPVPISDIISGENFQIISYNKDLIEDNEDDVIQHLQDRIYNYRSLYMIPYYALSDNLFIASQYHIFYTYLLNTLFSIRLKNAKTLKAHSYHILNYLASHHYLDEFYPYLTRSQALFLYRNLLYLDNYAGREDVFKLLIQRLFTDRNITVVNYIQSQQNVIDNEHFTDYRFNQKLLNNAALTYSTFDYTLEDLKNKEFPLAPSNPEELTYELNRIDGKFKNTLFNTLLTKDIEAITVDNTDTVKYKLIPTLIDFWAYLLQQNQINFLVSILDPVGNVELRLNTKDLFKLFILTLFKLNGRDLDHFPDYLVKRVYQPTLPTSEFMLGRFYSKYYWYKELLDEIIHYVPAYRQLVTSYEFQQFISSVYNYDIALWVLLSNMSDKDTNGQFEGAIDSMMMSTTYSYGDETPDAFLRRIGLGNFFTYNDASLEALQFSILNNLYDNKLSFINNAKYIQQAMIEVFKKFNSYTVQFIDNYTSTTPILSGIKGTRAVVDLDVHRYDFFAEHYLLNLDIEYKSHNANELDIGIDITDTISYHSSTEVDVGSSFSVEATYNHYLQILINSAGINSLGQENWLVTESSEADKLFLSMNQI